MKKKNNWTLKEKQEIVKYKEKYGIAETTRKYGIPERYVYRWKKLFDSPTFSNHDNDVVSKILKRKRLPGGERKAQFLLTELKRGDRIN